MSRYLDLIFNRDNVLEVANRFHARRLFCDKHFMRRVKKHVLKTSSFLKPSKTNCGLQYCDNGDTSGHQYFPYFFVRVLVLMPLRN